MNVKELAKLLGQLSVPVSYFQFHNTPESPAPNPPFVIFLEEDSNNFGADNKVWKKIIDYRIEMYTDNKNLTLEQEMEALLDSHSIYYDTDETYIDTEKLFQKTYYITLIN
ncbi:hypothetical protein [Lysinibacillus capsici]|uniref:hypothetical protein n=1 Tax=Lysinibacillus capsici TaxID=2115968 RepID=UPI000E20B124|nr:hypothetical protein [Lysinibacillus capsici]RDV27120.1 hypothetical protein C7B89_19985 [Lysinibacillus capsici]